MMPSIVADGWRRVNDLLAMDRSASRTRIASGRLCVLSLPFNGR
jgi:hypothetical protein